MHFLYNRTFVLSQEAKFRPLDLIEEPGRLLLRFESGQLLHQPALAAGSVALVDGAFLGRHVQRADRRKGGLAGLGGAAARHGLARRHGLPAHVHHADVSLFIDVGEAVAEQLALALDPYPRAPGASFAEGGESEQPEDSPFKVLAGLVKKDKS